MYNTLYYLGDITKKNHFLIHIVASLLNNRTTFQKSSAPVFDKPFPFLEDKLTEKNNEDENV